MTAPKKPKKNAQTSKPTSKPTGKPNPRIITCAITGAIHTPTMSPHLPLTAAQIADQAIGAAKAGAAILHLHARGPQGRPSSSPDDFNAFIPHIRQEVDAVINITTGGGLGMSLDERLAAAKHFAPELASLNMGSINFGLYPALDKWKTWQHAWEPDFLAMTRDFIFRNTFADIEQIIKTLEKAGTRFEFECYDVGHLYTLAHFLDRKVVKPPLFVQMVMGILGGIGGEVDQLLHMVRTAERLLGDAFVWSVLGTGRQQMALATTAAILGGHVRVGLEDSLYLQQGKMAQTNAQQVFKIRGILEALSIPIATAAQARSYLALRGAA